VKPLLLLALVLLTGATVQRRTPVIELPSWAFPDGVMAATVCSTDDAPVILVRVGLDPVLRTRVLAHERVHVRQLATECLAKQARYVIDADFRLDQELEAYCPDAQAFRDRYPDIEVRFIQLLRASTGHPDSARVARLVRARCPL